MNQRERKVVFKVLGRDIALRVQHDHESVMHEIIGMVNDRLAQVRANLPTETDLTTMTLTCIALAEELYHAQLSLNRVDLQPHALPAPEPIVPTPVNTVKTPSVRRSKRRTEE
ncbi:MAG TPA: cell division protein ZapA [Rhodothermales bacterium]|nr:cell division protein ZapA [Rhodothermales bacterium]HRR08075.1 cell division protein ZapA [Rhodothermales bacterium]